MQFSQFPTGGFVVHRIPTTTTKGHVSGWFNSSGIMVDAEILYPDGRRRDIKRHGPTWTEAQRNGGMYGMRQRQYVRT